jgi:hypothetical protein
MWVWVLDQQDMSNSPMIQLAVPFVAVWQLMGLLCRWGPLDLKSPVSQSENTMFSSLS